MTKAKDATMIFLAVVLAFAFGWTARGDAMYSAMFEQKAQIMEKLK